jgi:hypothetical protein
MGAQNYRPMAKLVASTEPLQFRRGQYANLIGKSGNRF